ncbi:SAF domain-containing protein [Nonomuraea sp. NPDC050556]|uniref:SAF domain-containing protein n=1 Tax=Nonomuraea sp. NPDC050556 TaxID=3364369 RepID=UPI00378F639A
MRAWIRRFGRRRRLVAAALVGVSLLCVLTALAPGQPGASVLVAARDLAPGVLGTADLSLAALPRSAVPDGALTAGAVGRVLAAPMRRGEPLTDVRLVGTALLAALPPGAVATPVRIADPDAARLIAPGSLVGVLAAWEGGQAAQLVADDVTVLATPATNDDHGALVVLATTTAQAGQLAAAQAGGRLSLTIKRHLE